MVRPHLSCADEAVEMPLVGYPYFLLDLHIETATYDELHGARRRQTSGMLRVPLSDERVPAARMSRQLARLAGIARIAATESAAPKPAVTLACTVPLRAV